jgi:hypothetical protein
MTRRWWNFEVDHGVRGAERHSPMKISKKTKTKKGTSAGSTKSLPRKRRAAAPAKEEPYLGEPITEAFHAELLATNAAVRAQGDRPALLGGAMHHLPEHLRVDPGTSKKTQVIEWLQRPNGVLRSSLMAALGWQAHTVRSFVAGAVKPCSPERS